MAAWGKNTASGELSRLTSRRVDLGVSHEGDLYPELRFTKSIERPAGHRKLMAAFFRTPSGLLLPADIAPFHRRLHRIPPPC